MQLRLFILAVALWLVATPARAESLAEIGARVGRDTDAAYNASPYLTLSRDYFSRFSRDPSAVPRANEVAVDTTWCVVTEHGADPVVARMAGHLGEFLAESMNVSVSVVDSEALPPGSGHAIALKDHDGGVPGSPGSYSIAVRADGVSIRGFDPAGLRDGVVQLVDRMASRAAPILALGETTRTARLGVRLGSIPWGGSYRETVFLGYNAVLCGGGSLHALSTSDAIPELAARRVPGLAESNAAATATARAYGLKTYAFLNTRQKFPEDDPVLLAHPEIRGARTWKADGEFTLCTEHPLVQQWLDESIEHLFRADPKLDGIVIIIGGEGFYHCFMRPYGVEKGHTNCPRCEALGAEQTVANLCNRMARAARRVNPSAEVVIWPYSAEHVWSADKTQAQFIAKLEPGTAILTEIEKDEYVEKPEGVRKHLWDYSIDLIGPGERAKAQIAACQARGIPCYLKSEPESAFEAPRLPHIPSLDRWWDRADALATCGAKGAWVFPAFRNFFGTSPSEINKFAWWLPGPTKDEALLALAARIAGDDAAVGVRQAWGKVSEAIPWSPELPSYYTGPYYLGPAQPMIANPDAAVPEVFDGYYLFMAEISDDEGVKKRPTYYTKPTGDVPVFARYYRKMEALLGEAAAAMDAASAKVPDRCRVTFDAENSSIQWFYRTARSEANFYQSCMLRDRVLALVAQETRTSEEITEAQALLKDWDALLRDERENARAALPLAEADPRLDAYFGGDHTFSHTADMLRAKLAIIDEEIDTFLPGLQVKLK